MKPLLNIFPHLQLSTYHHGNTTNYLVDIGYMNHWEEPGHSFQWARFVLLILLPAIILTFCNLSLIRALHKSYRMRKQYQV